MKNALSQFEQQLLSGKTTKLETSDAGTLERWHGLIALAQGDELKAIQHFSRAVKKFEANSLPWAINERWRGLALIRAQREVEGTWALERSNPILLALGYGLFGVDVG